MVIKMMQKLANAPWSPPMHPRGWFCYLLWIWKNKIVVNNTFLVPTLTCETIIYWRAVSWDSKEWLLRKEIPQWCGQALFTISQLKVINNNVIKSSLSRCVYHVHFRVIQTQVHNDIWEQYIFLLGQTNNIFDFTTFLWKFSIWPPAIIA